MKKLLLFAIILLSLLSAHAQGSAESPAVAPALSMVEGMINVDMRLNLRDIPVKSSEVTIVVPYLVNGRDSLALGSIGVYGRRRYIQYERGLNGNVPLPEVAIKASQATEDYHFSTQVAYQEWMDGATLNLKMDTYGCANCAKGSTAYVNNIGKWLSPRTSIAARNLIYISPEVANEKVRNIDGIANVDFQVNRTVLLEDFRNNYAELANIRASIDSVRDNRDATINSIYICGFASPEGTYSNNQRLAIGRTEALADYVKRIYNFPDGLITTASVAEDWDGLRNWVENSYLEHRAEILDIIDDSSLNPDARDAKIRKSYPAEYEALLNTVYPALRHTEYRISYTVRSYSDPEEILYVMKTNPGNLSLDELFLAAQTLEPDSDEFRELFEVAVRLYPSDPVANLNAANTALLRGDAKSARAYLEKAGDSKEAIYTRGVLAILEKDYDEAQVLLTRALDAGIPQAQEMLMQATVLKEYEKGK